jgi:hypothetical protein
MNNYVCHSCSKLFSALCSFSQEECLSGFAQLLGADLVTPQNYAPWEAHHPDQKVMSLLRNSPVSASKHRLIPNYFT